MRSMGRNTGIESENMYMARVGDNRLTVIVLPGGVLPRGMHQQVLLMNIK